MINSEIRRFMDEARSTFAGNEEIEVRLFQDLRGQFVAVTGIDSHAFKQKLAIPDPKIMRVVFFPSKDYFGYSHMIDNPYFTVKQDD